VQFDNVIDKRSRRGTSRRAASSSGRMALPQVAGARVEVADRYAADLVVKTSATVFSPGTPVLLMLVFFIGGHEVERSV